MTTGRRNVSRGTSTIKEKLLQDFHPSLSKNLLVREKF